MRFNPYRQKTAALAAAALLLAATSGPWARAAEPAVLDKVPADAYGLIVINNVRAFSNRLSNVATRLNLGLPPDLVGYFTRDMGITRGFDANSSAALILLKPTAEKLAAGYFKDQPPAVLLLPTNDAKSMLAPFAPGEPDKDGISEVKLPQDPTQKGYVAIVDGKENQWVAMTTTKEDMQAYLARTDSFAAKATPEIHKVFDANSLVIWGNVPKLEGGSGLDKIIEDAQADMAGSMDLANLTSNLDPFSAAMQRQYIDVGFAFVKEFMKDANSTMMTARFTDSGLTIGLVGDFKPDTPMGKFVASQKTAKPASLTGLPAGNGTFLAAGAINWDPASMASAMDNMGKLILSDPDVSKDARAADFKKAMDINKQLMAITNGWTLVFLDPANGGKNGYINGMVLVDTPDPQKYIDLEKESIKASLVTTAVLEGDMKQEVTVTPDAVTIKDVKLTKMTVKVTLREEKPDKPLSPESRMGFNVVQQMYGPDGLSTYFGIVGKRVVIVMGNEQSTLEAGITAAQNDTNALAQNPMILATKDQVVPNPVAMIYLPVTRWITLLQNVMVPNGAAGSGPITPSIANAPPIVLSAGVNGNMMTAEVHIPISTITGINDAMTRLQRAAQAGAATPAAPGRGRGTP